MAYKAMKSVITNGITNKNLDTTDVKNKLDVFLAGDRITIEQYNELLVMVTAYEESLVTE